MTRVKCSQLRGKKPGNLDFSFCPKAKILLNYIEFYLDELQKQLSDLRQELNSLRVGKVTGSGGAQKLGKIYVMYENQLHGCLIVRNQSTKDTFKKIVSWKKI